MREILFRGKRKDNGEWVEGDLIHLGNRAFIAAGWLIEGSTGGFTSFDCDELYEIDPKTVGQFTGLTDNSKKIFEGDIVKAWNTMHDRGEFFTVRWAEQNGFYFADDCETNWHHDHLDQIEIIGNAFDNPDMIMGWR